MDLERLKIEGEELQRIGRKPCTTRDNPPVLKVMFELAKNAIEKIQPRDNPCLQEIIDEMEHANSTSYPYESTVKIGNAIVRFTQDYKK